MNCTKLIEHAFKSKHHSKWIKSEIKRYEKIENRTHQEQWKLCNLKSIITSVPFSGCREIYELCESCEYGNLFLRMRDVYGNPIRVVD